MHQIRAHAAFLGLSLLGDKLYGGGHTPEDAPHGVTFFLHHMGLTSPDGVVKTDAVPTPKWASAPREPQT
jgi:23S rRNA-/tRNA-specific pseudouridylate synthase